jgi:hypothetical protein
MSLDYDGVTSLRLEIKKRLNKTSHTTQADYIADGCEALEFDKRKKGASGKPVENVAILRWLLENKTATRNKSKGQVMTISATGIAVNLILGVNQNNHVTFELAKQFAARDGIKRTGKKLTDYISDNKQAAIEFVEAQNKARQLARDDIMATGSAKPLADYVEQIQVEQILQNNVEPIQQNNVEPIQQKTPKQYANKYQFKSVAFNTSDGKNKTRHVIKLENYFIEALKQIGVDNLPAFLSEITTTEWNESTGDKSIMKIVKASIVNELLKKAGNKQNGKV